MKKDRGQLQGMKRQAQELTFPACEYCTGVILGAVTGFGNCTTMPKISNMDKNKIKHESHRKLLSTELKDRSGFIRVVEEPADCLIAPDHAFDLKTDLFSGRQTL